MRFDKTNIAKANYEKRNTRTNHHNKLTNNLKAQPQEKINRQKQIKHHLRIRHEPKTNKQKEKMNRTKIWGTDNRNQTTKPLKAGNPREKQKRGRKQNTIS
ncbi:hypothetical protein HYE04_04100 [Mycoplasmopsis bovis]|nr:hypothetical protein [Mycoplasmopsis bovis]QQH27908.1 hypothetical protein HYE04_04100 [Mycoplasmopsis bovis]